MDKMQDRFVSKEILVAVVHGEKNVLYMYISLILVTRTDILHGEREPDFEGGQWEVCQQCFWSGARAGMAAEGEPAKGPDCATGGNAEGWPWGERRNSGQIRNWKGYVLVFSYKSRR